MWLQLQKCRAVKFYIIVGILQRQHGKEGKYIEQWIVNVLQPNSTITFICSSIPPCRAKAKLDINAQSIMGRTALHDAITVGHKEIVKLLLKGGADVNLAYNPDQVDNIIALFSLAT